MKKYVLVKTNLMTKLKLLVVVSMVLGVASCGQKGALYLPQEQLENTVEALRKEAEAKRAELEQKIQDDKQE